MHFEALKGFTIKRMIKLYKSKKLNLNPPYQRNDIWTDNDKKYLIDSIVKNYPIQNFYIRKSTSNKYDIIDGQQRIRAIMGYYDNDYPLDKIFYKDSKKDKFLNYNLEVTMVKDANEEKIIDFYTRVNKYDLHLNRPELKKAEYFDTIFLKLIQQCSSNKKLLSLDLFADRALDRMNDMDFISELLTQQMYKVTEKKIQVDKIYDSDISEEKASKEYLIFV